MTRVVEGPVTEAGRTILAKLSRTPYIALADPRLAILAIEAAARAEAGHRIPEPHDCFLMNCARLGDELRRMGAAYVEMQRLHIELGDEMADRIAAARAEVIAEIRAGVEAAAEAAVEEVAKSKEWTTDGLLYVAGMRDFVRHHLPALLPSVPPKA